MRNRRGSILIVILWSLFFLAMLAMAINAYIWPQLELSGRLLSKAKMHYLARAGVYRSIFEIESDKAGLYSSLHDSWSTNDEAFKDVPLGAGTFSVIKPALPGESKPRYGLTDEESKININKAAKDVLSYLFEKEAGLESDDALKVADSILDWVDKDDSLHVDGREDSYYQSLSKPYHCKNGDFQVLEELLLVYGVTRDAFDKIKDIITIYGDGKVNVNTADRRVLLALGIDEELVDEIIKFRSGSYSKKEDKENLDAKSESASQDSVFTDAAIAAVLGAAIHITGHQANQLDKIAPLLGVKSDNFRGTVKGMLQRKGTSEDITFVYDRADKVIKYWREE